MQKIILQYLYFIVDEISKCLMQYANNINNEYLINVY